MKAACQCVFQYVCFQEDGEAHLSDWASLGLAWELQRCLFSLNLEQSFQGNPGK